MWWRLKVGWDRYDFEDRALAREALAWRELDKEPEDTVE